MKKSKKSLSVPKVYIKGRKPSFLDWNSQILLSSLRKIDMSIISIVILDILFYFFSYYIFIFWLQRIQDKMATFNLPADIAILGFERTQQLVSEARIFLYIIIFSFILVLLAIIFIASIINSVIWAKVTNTKITFVLVSKFLGLNLIWMSFWFVLIFLISWLVQPASAPLFMITAIILGFYFTNTLYTIFMEKQKLRNIIDAVKLNITKIHLFLLPYAIIFLLFYIIFRINNIITFNYSSFFFGLVLVTYAALVRYYISNLVVEIEKIKPKSF